VTYNPNIPQFGTRINQTFNLITINFGQLNTIFQTDHYTWNDASVANRGLHRHCTLVSQAAPPTPSATAGIAFCQSNVSPSVTRIDPYYEFDTGTLGNGLTAPLVPFKAFCQFTANSPTVITSAFNINTITGVLASSLMTFTVKFVNKLTDNPSNTAMNYVVFLASSLISSSSADSKLYYGNTTNSGLTIFARNTSGFSASNFISMGIIQL